MGKKFWNLVGGLGLLLFFLDLGAQAREAVKMEEVVITATKTERVLEEVPGRIQVITKEDIQLAPGQKIDDYLNNLSGVSVIRPSGIYTMTPNVTLRGLGAEGARTSVLVNGMPINKSDTGEVNWNRINVDDIERIEVFKGPGSSLYGNNAMGGVINIITKTPEKAIEGNVSGKYGTYNTYGANASLSGSPLGKTSGPYFRASGFYQKSDGYISTAESARTPYTADRFLEEANGALTLGYRVNPDHRIEVTGSYYNDKRGEGTKIRAPDGVSRDFDTGNLSLLYQGGIRDLRWEIKGYYQLEDYRRVSETLRGTTYTRFDVQSDREERGLLFHVSKNIFSNNRLTVGADVKRGSIDGLDEYKTSPDYSRNSGKLDLYGIFLQDEQDLFDGQLNLLGGLRYDYAKFHDGSYFSTLAPFSSLNGNLKENSWSAWSPRLSARYSFLKNLSAYVSYGRGFRASILDDLTRFGILWGLYKEANPDLEPETIDNYEIGVDFKLIPGMKISATFFYSQGKDFLYFVPTGRSLAGRPLYRRENIGKVEIQGAEIDTRYALNKSLILFANYTYNYSEIISFSKNPALEGTELTNSPRHQIKAGVDWLNRFLNSGAYVHYKGSQFVYTNEVRQTTKKIPDYYTVDLKFWRDVYFKNLIASLTIQNVFDKRYLESDTDLSPGRFIFGELGYSF